MRDWTTRPVTDDEFETFFAIRREGLRDIVLAVFGPWDDEQQRGFAREDFDKPRPEFIVRGGDIVGYRAWEDHGDHLFLDQIVIAEGHRDRGLGREVVEELQARGRELRLSVLGPNRAQALYERLGFRVTHVEPPRVKMTWTPDVQPRARCSVFIAASLDGFIAQADGGIKWLDIVDRPGEDYGFVKFFAGVDTMVIGRGTYDIAAGFPEWPYADKRVVVVTHRPIGEHPNTSVATGTPAEILATVPGASHIYVDGGNLIAQFLAAGAIDAMTISVIPIVLGGGLRLFPGGEGEHLLALVAAKPFKSGLVQLTYRLR